MNIQRSINLIILMLLTTFITLAQNKDAEPYDIYDYVGKSKALADIENFSNLSIPVYETYLKEKDIPYGLSKRETFDYFSNPAYDKPNAVFVFIHGGYWQGGLKESYAFVGKWFLENNIDFILIEYDLTKENKLNNETLPRVTMTAIAGEIGRALDHIQTYLPNNSGISPEIPVFLSGHSAGGHLAALSKDHPIVNTAVFPISGLFDLTPIAKTKVVGEALQLNEKEITNLSPIKKLTKASKCSPDIHLYYGGAEMNELIEQSTNYYVKSKEFGHKASIYNIENADHFEILNQLFINQDSPLFNKIKNYIKNKL